MDRVCDWCDREEWNHEDGWPSIRLTEHETILGGGEKTIGFSARICPECHDAIRVVITERRRIGGERAADKVATDAN